MILITYLLKSKVVFIASVSGP